MALQKTEKNFTEPVIFTLIRRFRCPDTKVPLPANPRLLPVPTGMLDQRQIDLAWAHHGEPGGYKVPALVGLYWSAPYLPDGGLAAGKDADTELGLPGTVAQYKMPYACNSLEALIDRNPRTKVEAANVACADLHGRNVEGSGQNYSVDAPAGFNPDQQRALILYLLSYELYLLSYEPGL